MKQNLYNCWCKGFCFFKHFFALTCFREMNMWFLTGTSWQYYHIHTCACAHLHLIWDVRYEHTSKMVDKMKWNFWNSKAKFEFWVPCLYLKFPNHDINPYLNLSQCIFLHSIPFSVSETGYALVSSFLRVMWLSFIFMIVWNFSNEIPCFWRLWAVWGIVDVIFYTVLYKLLYIFF